MDDTLTTAEAARQLGVTPQAIGQWVRAGRLEYVKKLPGVRGAYLFDPASVEALQKGKQQHG